MKKPEELPLRERVRRWVVEHGHATTAQVFAAVGRYVSASHGTRAGRGRGAKSGLAEQGARVVISNCLNRLFREGKLSRPAKGVYAPPLPRLFVPAEAG